MPRATCSRPRPTPRWCCTSSATISIAGRAPVEAAKAALQRLQGAFALAIIFAGEDDLMIGARQGSPLAIGHGHGEMYLGSDAIALAPFTDSITYLEEGDWAVLTPREAPRSSTATAARSSGRAIKSVASSLLVDKGNHRHFMAKEIHEQPEVISHTLANYIDFAEGRVHLPDLGIDPASIVAGLHLRLRHRLLRRAGRQILVRALCAHSRRDRRRLRVPLPRAAAAQGRAGALHLAVGRDRRHAGDAALLQGARASASPRSSMCAPPPSRASPTSCCRRSPAPRSASPPPRPSPASSRVLACLAIALGRARGTISAAQGEGAGAGAGRGAAPHRHHAAQRSAATRSWPTSSPRRATCSTSAAASATRIALEGALKLKEISYIHAEGYAAGELKHGPIALIDENVPVIVVAPQDDLFEKTMSNMQEVAARGGQIILMSDAGAERAGCALEAHLPVPTAHPFTNPLLYAVPVQLLAYHTAVFMGTDVDQPRNLAKSVTVE